VDQASRTRRASREKRGAAVRANLSQHTNFEQYRDDVAGLTPPGADEVKDHSTFQLHFALNHRKGVAPSV
jgi:hypothetical protein